MEKKDKKKDNKKSFVLILFVLAIIALAGYGVYSYFWTDGTFSGTSDTVNVASFDPETDVSGFVGNGGSITLTCPRTTSGNSTENCTGTVNVSNYGDTAISVSVQDGTANVSEYYDPDNSYSGNANENATAGTPTFTWDEETIEANDNTQLHITVPVTFTSNFNSSESIERNEPYQGGSYQVEVNFNIKASQVH